MSNEQYHRIGIDPPEPHGKRSLMQGYPGLLRETFIGHILAWAIRINYKGKI